MDLIGRVRLVTGDRVPAPQVFSDADITQFLTDNDNNVNLAAADLLEAWAALYAANPTNETIGDYSYGQKTSQNMLDMAKRLREKENDKPVMDYAEFGETE